jgi:hypothetical protein
VIGCLYFEVQSILGISTSRLKLSGQSAAQCSIKTFQKVADRISENNKAIISIMIPSSDTRRKTKSMIN